MALLPTVFLGMYNSDREFLSRVWDGLSVKEVITSKAISTVLGLGIPGMLQLMFEWCTFEEIALLYGVFSNEGGALLQAVPK